MRMELLAVFSMLAISSTGTSPSSAQTMSTPAEVKAPVAEVIQLDVGRHFKNHAQFVRWVNIQTRNRKTSVGKMACEGQTGMINVELFGSVRRWHRPLRQTRQMDCAEPLSRKGPR